MLSTYEPKHKLVSQCFERHNKRAARSMYTLKDASIKLCACMRAHILVRMRMRADL